MRRSWRTSGQLASVLGLRRIIPLGVLKDPVAELDHAPLHADQPRNTTTIDITFIHDTPPAPHLPPTATVRDIPAPGRTFTTRDLWETQRPLPAGLCAGRGTLWLTALAIYTQTTAAQETS
ncbi:hypothetical protein ACWDE0_40940 [Streptomyces sp. 900105755]